MRDGDDLRRRPKSALSKLLIRSRGGIQYVEHAEGHGDKMFAAVCELGLEGIVSKKLNAPYRSGPSKNWIKVKNPRAPAATRILEGTFFLTVYAVLEDFGKHGAAWREIDEIRADEQSIVEGILRGEYERILRIVAFNADEGWARDVTRDIALKVTRAARQQNRKISALTREFIERVTGRDMSELA
jgi:hypothetical protein